MNGGRLAWGALLGIACAVTGCGAKASNDVSNKAAGGAQSDGGSAVVSAAGKSPRLCPVEESIAAPPKADGCTVTPAELEPEFSCESDGCPITKALDIDCRAPLAEPRITANADSAWVIVRTESASANAQLVTVTANESRVQPLAAPLPSRALAADRSGCLWVFDADAYRLWTLRSMSDAWHRAMLTIDTPLEPAIITSAFMVDGGVGYVTFLVNGIEPHLATWDGTCWTDAKLGDGSNEQFLVKGDQHARPSVAWEAIGTAGFVIGTRSITVSNPRSGMPDEHIVLPLSPQGTLEYGSPRLRLLAGGLNGTDAFPTVALKLWDGIALFTYDTSVDSHWATQTLPASEPAAATGNCPEMANHGGLPCDGLITCSERVHGTGSDFDLVRTQAGGWYAAWLEYDSDATYDIERVDIGGEMFITHCVRHETSGAGPRDLVSAQHTSSEPVLHRFRLYEGDVQSTKDGIGMTTRGDTLLVAAILNRSGTPILRYLEIDSTRLP